MKKRIISIFLIISVITSLFAVTAVSSSAATKPATPVVKIHNGGSANGLYVTWDNISPRATYQIAYRPYGYRAYNYTNTNKTNMIDFFPKTAIKIPPLNWYIIPYFTKKVKIIRHGKSYVTI